MSTREAAVQQVDVHVEPKSCFVTRDTGSNSSWRPLGGTGCAHWVAHQLGITGGVKGSTACMDGYLLRVPDLVSGMTPVQLADVQTMDIWTNNGKTHTGLVWGIKQDKDGKVEDLTIRHCSSGQHGVVENSYKSHFSGSGHFYRHSAATTARANGSKEKSRHASFLEKALFS